MPESGVLRRQELAQLILAFLLGSQSLSGYGASLQESRDEVYQKAREKLDAGDALGARQDLERLYSENPRSGYLFEIAVCEFQLGNYEKSYQAFSRAAQDQPEFLEIRLGLAKSMYRLDRGQEARREFVRVLQQQPQNEEALFYLGLLASAEHDYGSALAYFEKTVRLYPMNPAALFNAGQMLVRLKDPEQARAYFNRHHEALEKLNEIYPLKVAARQPGADASTWVELGDAYLKAGMQPQALDAFQAARRLGQDPAGAGSLGAGPTGLLPGVLATGSRPPPPENWSVAFERGQEHREAGRLDDAIVAFRAAYEQAPGNPEPLVGIAEIQMSIGAWREALNTAKFLSGGFPAFAHGHFLRASCLTQLGRYPAARRWVERSLKIDPYHQLSLELLERIDQVERGREQR